MSFLFSAGGIILVSATRRITIDNTLDERLRLLEDKVRFTFFMGWLTRYKINLDRCYQKFVMTCMVRTKIASFFNRISFLAIGSLL